MCGIAGEIRLDGDASDHIEAEVACLKHRGPDAQGVFDRGAAWIGQTRLAIIDLRTGDPPITNEDGCVGVALNGEIYNFRQLRERLRAQGHVLATEGDTEVIAHLAEDLEPVALARKLEGMFAFAVWDSRRGRLVLGRDRVGKKPLYYWSDGQRFVFGSEIKSLLANPHVPRVLSKDAIPAYLTFGYVPTPQTFYEGILSVPPGHVLVVEPGREVTLERYWQAPVPGVDGIAHLDIAPKHAAHQVRELLEAAVERRRISDVPLGAFLSGGIDSSAIVGLMARQSEQPVQTFTIGFEDTEGFDERPYARLVADAHHTEHHEFVVAPDAVDLVERLVFFHDQPFGDSSAIPTFLLSELTRRHVTVALSGDGGDELFAGYQRFAAGLMAQRYSALPGPLRSLIGHAAGLVPGTVAGGRAAKAQRFLAAADEGLPNAYLSFISFVREADRAALLNGVAGNWGIDDYLALWSGSSGASPLDRLLNLNLRTYLVDDLMVKTDRMSMAHGLEVRCPFLDRELLEFTARLPPRMKARGMSLKRVLRAAVADLLPPEILRRGKRGFGVPLDRWFREDLRSYLDATLGNRDASVRRHLQGAGVDRLIAEHTSGARNHGHSLWTLLTLEVFLRREGW